MTYSNDAATRETLAKLAETRAEILRILEPPPDDAASAAAPGQGGHGFPRSRTMRLLMSGRGIGTVGAVLGGFAIARPAIAFRLLRMLPATAVARLLLVKTIASFRSGSKRRSAAQPSGSPEEPAAGGPAADPAADRINPS